MKISIFSIFDGTLYQLLAAILGSISAISDGMQYGWSAPMGPILTDPQAGISPYVVSGVQLELLENIYLVGSICGLPATIYLVDKIGRHPSILVSTCCSLLGWLLMGLGPSVEYLLGGRFLAGMAGDMAFVAAPMYIAEIADQKVRGFLASIIYLMMLIGILLIYCIAPFTAFVTPALLGAGLMLLQLVLFPLMPHSPYYLVAKGQQKAARKALITLRARHTPADRIDMELTQIQQAVERQRSERGRPQDILLVASNRKALIIVCMLNFAQHFSGISVLLMNLHDILHRAGSVYMTPSTAGILFSGLMLVAATLASFTVDKYGRKVLLVISCIGSSLCLLALGTYFALHTYYMATLLDSSVTWIPVVAIMAYAAFFKLGLGIVPVVLTAELYPAKVKAIGMTTADTIYIVFSLLSIVMYNWMSRVMGVYLPFFVFAFCTVLMAIFSATYIPETKGRTLDEIQMQLKGVSVRHLNAKHKTLTIGDEQVTRF